MVFCGSGGTTVVDGCACWTGVGVGAAVGGASCADESFGAAAVVGSAGVFLALALRVVAGLAAEACRRFRQAVLDDVLFRLLQ